ncbi:hypothetical protein JCM13664_17180 [Methylothermus subterraneus]
MEPPMEKTRVDDMLIEMIAEFEKAQVKMQETIITTMKWYIGGAGIVLVVLKALDIFVAR